jgi:SAM-dependent methyltransferase
MVDLIAAHYDTALREHCRGDLLDLGCGRAPLYILYRDLAASITCVDWGSSPHDVCHADELCDLNEPIPLPDASFDTIIFSDVLEHLYQPHQVIKGIRRLLRPGGKLLMNVPFMYWLHEQPYDYFRYTQFALQKMVEDSGMEIVDLQALGGAPEVLADLTAKLLVRIRFVGTPIARASQAMCYAWTRSRWGRRISQSTARQFPLGYFLVAVVP